MSRNPLKSGLMSSLSPRGRRNNIVRSRNPLKSGLMSSLWYPFQYESGGEMSQSPQIGADVITPHTVWYKKGQWAQSQSPQIGADVITYFPRSCRGFQKGVAIPSNRG